MSKTKKYHIYGLGHAMVDIEYQVEDSLLQKVGLDKGRTVLADAGQQVQLVMQLPGKGRYFCGGSAANTVVTASRLGADTFYACCVADDENGRLFQAGLEEAGVDNSPEMRKPGGTTATCLVMVTPDAERSMSAHLGISAQLAEGNISADAVSSAAWIYLEGYLSSLEAATEAATLAHRLGRRQGAQIAFNLSDCNLVSHYRSGLEAMLADKVDLLFCNEQEAVAWTGDANVRSASESLLSVAKTCVVTRNEKGCLCFDGHRWFETPAVATDVVDTTGAGDIFAGAFLYSLATGGHYEEAAALAVRAASMVISHFGPRLLPNQYAVLLG